MLYKYDCCLACIHPNSDKCKYCEGLISLKDSISKYNLREKDSKRCCGNCTEWYDYYGDAHCHHSKLNWTYHYSGGYTDYNQVCDLHSYPRAEDSDPTITRAIEVLITLYPHDEYVKEAEYFEQRDEKRACIGYESRYFKDIEDKIYLHPTYRSAFIWVNGLECRVITDFVVPSIYLDMSDEEILKDYNERVERVKKEEQEEKEREILKECKNLDTIPIEWIVHWGIENTTEEAISKLIDDWNNLKKWADALDKYGVPYKIGGTPEEVEESLRYMDKVMDEYFFNKKPIIED